MLERYILVTGAAVTPSTSFLLAATGTRLGIERAVTRSRAATFAKLKRGKALTSHGSPLTRDEILWKGGSAY